MHHFITWNFYKLCSLAHDLFTHSEVIIHYPCYQPEKFWQKETKAQNMDRFNQNPRAYEANLLREEFRRREQERVRRERWDANVDRAENYRHRLQQSENVRIMTNDRRIARYENRRAIEGQRLDARNRQLDAMTRQEFERRERVMSNIRAQNHSPTTLHARQTTARNIERANGDRLIQNHHRNLSTRDDLHRRDQAERARQTRETNRQRTWRIRMDNRENLAGQDWYREQNRRQQEDARQRAQTNRAQERRRELNGGFNYMHQVRR